MKRATQLLLAFFALISLVLPHGSAFAQAANEESQAAAAAYRQALALYAAGDLKGALASMRESHRLSQRSELLYNIARLEGELGDCAASLADYRLYVQQVPQGRYRSDAEQASRQLEQRCPDAPPAPELARAPAAVEQPPALPPAPIVEHPEHAARQPSPPPPPSQPSPPPYWTTRRWLGWSLVAAGTVAGVGGVYFTTRAIDARDAFQDNVNAAIIGRSRLDLSLQDQQHRDQHWAQALYAAGGALLASGVVVLIWAPANAGGAASSASLCVEPGLLAARFTHRF